MRSAVLVFVVTFTGCALVTGLGDYGPAGGGGQAGAEDRGGGGAGEGAAFPSCGDGTCLPVAEEGWEGPVLVSWRTGDAVDCPVLWSDDLGELHADPLPHGCSGCECDVSNAGCGSVEVEVYDANDTNCAGDVLHTLPVPLANCQGPPLSSVPEQFFRLEGVPVVAQGQCTGGNVAPDVVGPAFGANAKLCSPSTVLAGDCPAGLACRPGVPADYFACIWRSGDVAPDCPDAYPHPQLAHQSFTDGRGCSLCGCAFPRDATCDHSVLIYAQGGCAGTPVTLPFDGTCSIVDAWSASESIDSPTPPAGLACDASGGDPTGQIGVTDPISLCCTGEKP